MFCCNCDGACYIEKDDTQQNTFSRSKRYIDGLDAHGKARTPGPINSKYAWSDLWKEITDFLRSL